MRSSIVTSTYSGLDIDYSITTIDCGDEIKAPANGETIIYAMVGEYSKNGNNSGRVKTMASHWGRYNL